MKHKLKIAIFLILIFLASQLIGLAVTASYQKNFLKKETPAVLPQPQPVTNISETPQISNISVVSEIIPEKIEVKTKFDVLRILISFVIGLVLATIIFIILMHVGVIRFMRFWLFFVVVIGLFISLSLLFYEEFPFQIKIGKVSFSVSELFAFLLAIALAYFKVYKANIIVHNITELLIYPGIVILFLPLLNVIIVIVLLFLLSVYDFVAVFKTKHMQKMAKFMIKDVKGFSGVMIPYLSVKEKEKLIKLRAMQMTEKKPKAKKKKIKIKVNLAVLGGGDIAFPMLFSSIVFVTHTIYHSLFIILFSTIALTFLLLFGKRGEAYPALPPLAVGGLIGFLLSLLIL